MSLTRFALCLAATLAVAGALRPAAAQDERHLRQIFEGARVTALIDMPASQEGIDLVPGSSRPLDYQKYSGRIKKFGTAIKEGEKSIITKIKVKDDLIEIHLGGGGYGTFGDFLSSTLTNNGADSGAAQQLKISNERSQRAAAGSRFNLRFPNGMTPDDLEPEAVMAALEEYLTFPKSVLARRDRRPARPGVEARQATVEPVEEPVATPVSTVATTPERPAAIRKGMEEAEVEQLAGQALSSASNGPVTTKKYRWQDGVLEADFVNGVLVAYRISSN